MASKKSFQHNRMMLIKYFYLYNLFRDFLSNFHYYNYPHLLEVLAMTVQVTNPQQIS